MAKRPRKKPHRPKVARKPNYKAEEAAGRERNRRGFANPAGMTFGLLKAEVVAVAGGGWCEARMLDGYFTGWLCPHVHATTQEAKECGEKASLLTGSRPVKHVNDCREPDIDWDAGSPRRAPK